MNVNAYIFPLKMVQDNTYYFLENEYIIIDSFIEWSV